MHFFTRSAAQWLAMSWLTARLAVNSFAFSPLETVQDEPRAARTAPRPATATGELGAVEISQTQLPPYAASLVKIDTSGVTIKLGNEPRLVSFDQLLRTRFAGIDSRAGNGDLVIELRDSSVVRGQAITSDSQQMQITCGTSQFKIPTRQVASCQIRTLDAMISKQWESLLESRISSDVLILQRSAESLDKIEGVIGAVTDAAVKFQFDGQSIDVQRTKLAGWRVLFRSGSSRRHQWQTAGRGSRSFSLAVDDSKFDRRLDEIRKRSRLTLVCGALVKLPVANISEIDFSFGSMRFLADLEPLERKVQPRMALAVNLPQAENCLDRDRRPLNQPAA